MDVRDVVVFRLCDAVASRMREISEGEKTGVESNLNLSFRLTEPPEGSDFGTYGNMRLTLSETLDGEDTAEAFCEYHLATKDEREVSDVAVFAWPYLRTSLLQVASMVRIEADERIPVVAPEEILGLGRMGSDMQPEANDGETSN